MIYVDKGDYTKSTCKWHSADYVLYVLNRDRQFGQNENGELLERGVQNQGEEREEKGRGRAETRGTALPS